MTTNARLTPGAGQAWAYIRVSSDQQADKGLPLQGQREAVEAYCHEQDFRVTRTYTDEALSGATDDRPEFLDMVADAVRRRPAAVVMWKWDRFARNQDDAGYHKGEPRRGGVEIVTLADNIPLSAGDMRPVFEAMVHWRDQRYLKELSEASRRGQQTLMHMGYVPGAWTSATTPVGYQMVERIVVINGKERTARTIELDPETAPIARRAWEMRLAGATYRQIKEALRIFPQQYSLTRTFRNPLYRG